VSFQGAIALTPNILQLYYLNNSISIGHLCVYHGYGGQNVQGRDTLPPSFHSLSPVSFSLSSQYYNTHIKTSLQPLLHFSFYSLLEIFFLLLNVLLASPWPRACPLSTFTSLSNPFYCLFSFNLKKFSLNKF